MTEIAVCPSLVQVQPPPMVGKGVRLTEADADTYESLRSFRSTERGQMIAAIRELIEEAQKRVKSKYTPSRERTKWMNLAGKLIWYKDQVLRSMSYEALEKEVALLKKRVLEKDELPPRPPSQSAPR